MKPGAERIMVFWVPDWPVHAHLLDRATDPLDDRMKTDRMKTGREDATRAPAAIALVSQQRITACSEAARLEGVRIGLRVREAQSRCPDLATHPHDPEIDARRFAPVLAALESIVPGVEALRPGLCAMRARGPARFYGDEGRAATAIVALAAELGLPEAKVGVADGRFAAEQATRARPGDPCVIALHGVRIVPPGDSPAFLHPLPVERAANGELAEVLHGLGIRTLGALAALPEDAVAQRFGAEGVAARRRATGETARYGSEISPPTPEPELAVELDFEPPLDTSEQLAFACKGLAEQCIDGLSEARLVGTALRIELTDDAGGRHERVWLHPQRFTAMDVVNRIRWQADSMPDGSMPGDTGPDDPAGGTGTGIVRVRVSPVHTDRAAAHEPGLWSTAPDERVHHHLSRVQSRIGHTGVGTMELTGGRLLAERQRFVPWGTASRSGGRTRQDGGIARSSTRSTTRSTEPWPGALPGPVPGLVFGTALRAELTDAAGRPIGIDEEDLLTGRPVRLRVDDAALAARVHAWSLPWAIRERWWAGAPPRFRLQVQLETGDAWLLIHEAGRWLAEGRYD